jgi:hypothetical protein
MRARSVSRGMEFSRLSQCHCLRTSGEGEVNDPAQTQRQPLSRPSSIGGCDGQETSRYTRGSWLVAITFTRSRRSSWQSALRCPAVRPAPSKRPDSPRPTPPPSCSFRRCRCCPQSWGATAVRTAATRSMSGPCTGRDPPPPIRNTARRTRRHGRWPLSAGSRWHRGHRPFAEFSEFTR